MSGLKRRVSFGDASNSANVGALEVDKDQDKQLNNGSMSTRKRLATKAQNMFKSSGLSMPAHASFGSPSLCLDYSPHITATTIISKHTSASLSTLSLATMPRTDNFQGLPTPMFAADAYYFAPNTNPAAKRTTKPKPRSSVSSDTASTSKTSHDDIINSLYTASGPASLARTNSNATNHPRRTKKRPSTGVASTNVDQLVPVPTTPAITVKEPVDLPPQTTPTMPKPAYKLKNGKRHHPHPSSKAPYPRSYESTAIDHDTSNHIFFKQLSKSVTWHEFPTPPAKVLDLGCGNGVWILDAAKSWPNSHFVGLDLMPIQPNLAVVAPALQKRIQWCIANFLDRLPFDANHFDFIHIRRIARGVPENKWPSLLEEVSRVLKPDGALEVVEEDLIFPGGQEPCTCHYPPDIVPPDDLDNPQNDVSSSHNHEQPERPKANNTAHPFYYSSPSVNARDHTKLEEAYNDMHSSKFINLMPISMLTETLAHYFKDVRSHPPVLVTFPPPEEEMWSDGSASGVDGTSSDNQTCLRKSRPSTADSSIGSSGGSPLQSSQALSPTYEGRPSVSSVATEGSSLFALGPDPDEKAAAAESAAGFMTHPPAGGWHTLHLDVRSLVHPRQPFIMIDRCRMPARGYGLPSAVPTTGDESSHHGYGPMTRLPNTSFELDLQNLTLLLSQSVTDVLECSEAIWEYLVDQGKARTKKPPRAGMHSHSLSYGPSAAGSSSTTVHSTQGMIDREEFDHWIAKYEKEMHARIGMAEALRRRFGWETKSLTSDYVSTRAAIPPLPPFFSPTSTAPSSTPLRSRLNDPSSDDIHGGVTGHSSSSTSLASSGPEITGNTTNTMRKRTGSAPERVSAEYRKAGKQMHASRASQGSGRSGHSQQHHHARAHSLDAANAWEALTGSGVVAGNLVTAGEGEAEHQQGDGHGATGLEVELPRLSRCIRVFVAWNSKGV